MRNIETKYEVPRVLCYILIAFGWLTVAAGLVILLLSVSGAGTDIIPPEWRQFFVLEVVGLSITVIVSGLSTIVLFYVGLAVFDFADVTRESYLAEFGLTSDNPRNAARRAPVITGATSTPEVNLRR